MDIEKIPTEIYPYLKEIADRLWTKHASIMVGAGFSMNARKVNENCKRFPSWNQLGDCFFEKLYGKHPSDKDKSYLNVLKLADEVESTHGRSVLEKLLKDEISDKDFQPSELHEKLLLLPWVDVFTTNYDTLLERTAEKILEYRYETVINKQDLVWSTKPRIVKLHGSFPSERPFIITEEDYRTYPKRFAPFVNTVQQSLLENTLCLIGFSGNDPNFLNWIGWIRDNLGKENSPKIFLIGILSLTAGQRKLFEERNIIPIDLSYFDKSNHYNALSTFIGILSEFGKTEDNLDWPSSNIRSHINLKEGKGLDLQFEKVIKLWIKDRDAYPNWLIAPKDSRETLQMFTEDAYPFVYHLGKLEEPFLDILFLYELNWRLEKYLQPIFNDWINIYVNVIKKYNPFPDESENRDSSSSNQENTNCSEIKEKWIELQLSILRFYREESLNDEWEALDKKINKMLNYLSTQNIVRYHYERCLYYLFCLDIAKVEKELNIWKNDFTIPYWEVKRASVIAELGDIAKAENILDLSLKEIRSRLNLSPISNDYSLVSQEAYTLQILRDVRRSSIFAFEHPKEDKEKYTEKWNQLIQYKCDPWGELDSFQTYLASYSENDYKTEEKNYEFGIGRTTTTWKTGNNKYISKSYQYLRYREEVGLPYKLPRVTYYSEGLKNAISCIATYSPNWGFITFIRVGDTKYIDNIWGRKALALMDWNTIDELANRYLLIVKKATKDSKSKYSSITQLLKEIIPHILSRLCVKCSYSTKLDILGFLKDVYIANPNHHIFAGLDKLVVNLMKSFSLEEQINLIPNLIDFALVDDESVPDPISFIKTTKRKMEKDKINISPLSINYLINELANSDNKLHRKHIIISRLALLWRNNTLTQEQIDKFASNLWKEKNKDGFPLGSGYFYFAFLSLPHPKDVIPEELLKIYIKKTPIPIQSEQKEDIYHDISGRIDVLQNAIGTMNSDVNFQWNQKEFNDLIKKIISWWNLDKKYLLKKEVFFMGSIADEFKDRFKNMIKVFSSLVKENQNLVSQKNSEGINSILQELKEYDLPDLQAKASLIKLLPQFKDEITETIRINLFSKDQEKILDALNTLSILSEQKNIEIKEELEYVAQNIKCRTEIDLDRFIILIMIILRNQPELISQVILSDLEIGLSFLLDESKINRDDTKEEVHNKLLYRQSSSKLLVQLEDVLKKENKPIPNYIERWKESCLDINEFSEIRNIWLNGIDLVLD